MPSIVTSIIGGIQGSSAAHNAANAQVNGYQSAANTVNQAAGNANNTIGTAVNNSQQNLTNTATPPARTNGRMSRFQAQQLQDYQTSLRTKKAEALARFLYDGNGRMQPGQISVEDA